MPTPLLTIGIPCRNGEKTLPLTLQSIYAQTFQDWELIIVNDGSTDGTAAILDSLDDPRVRGVHHATAAGLATRLNEVIDLARGVWVGLQGAIEELLKLQKSIEDALVPLGFEPEDRPYRAHLTLGRVKGRRHLQLLQEAVLRRQDFQAEAFDVTEVVLYRSELRPEGARYSALFRAPLGAVSA